MNALPDAQIADVFRVAAGIRESAEASGRLPLLPHLLIWGDAENGGTLMYLTTINPLQPADSFMRLLGLACVAQAEALSLIIEIAVVEDPDELDDLPTEPVLASAANNDLIDRFELAPHRVAVAHVEPDSERQGLGFIEIQRGDDGELRFGDLVGGDLPSGFPFTEEMEAALRTCRQDSSVQAAKDEGLTEPIVVELCRSHGDGVLALHPRS